MFLGTTAAMITRADLLSTDEIWEARDGAALVLDNGMPGGNAGIGSRGIPRRPLLAGRVPPDGVLGLAPQPGVCLACLPYTAAPLYLITEGLEKPGNLGAILRSADAAGVTARAGRASVTVVTPDAARAVALPPRRSVPLEARSRYLLKVTDLSPGQYEVSCEGQTIGTADADALGAGINLNSMLLDGDRKAPWQALAAQVWDGTGLKQIGTTRWKFEIRKR